MADQTATTPRPATCRLTASVVYFDPGQGYGYVRPRDGDTGNVLVVADQLVAAEPLRAGDTVSCLVTGPPGRSEARDVILVAAVTTER